MMYKGCYISKSLKKSEFPYPISRTPFPPPPISACAHERSLAPIICRNYGDIYHIFSCVCIIYICMYVCMYVCTA